MKTPAPPIAINVAWKSPGDFVEAIVSAGLVGREEADVVVRAVGTGADAKRIAVEFVRRNLLTRFQAAPALEGRLNELVYGEYLVLDKIGAGGMGEVFKAVHRRMSREVALKLLPAEASSSPDAVARFHREVKAAAKLVHPNIVTAFDAGEANGRMYLVMELIEGRTLSTLVRKEGPLAPLRAIELIQQAALALGYAHEKGVIHRDVKPNNLLIDNDGRLKLLDLGLARLDDIQTGEKPRGPVMGTLDYMAPEQAEDTQQADARSDIYSLGCTLYALLIGKPLFRESTPIKTIAAHRNNPVPKLTELRSDISPALDAVFRKMVAKRAADRYQSMGEVWAALDECRVASGPVARPAPRPTPPPRKSREDSGELAAASTAATSLPTKEVPAAPAEKSPAPPLPPPRTTATLGEPEAPPTIAAAAPRWRVLAMGAAGVALLACVLMGSALTGFWLFYKPANSPAIAAQPPAKVAAAKPDSEPNNFPPIGSITDPAPSDTERLRKKDRPARPRPAQTETTSAAATDPQPEPAETTAPASNPPSETSAAPKFEALVTITFERNGKTKSKTYDTLQEAEWRLARMVRDLFDAHGQNTKAQDLTIRGFHAEVQTSEGVREFTDPNLAYTYVLHVRSSAGLTAPVAGKEKFDDLVVTKPAATPAEPAVVATTNPPAEIPDEPATAGPRPVGSTKFLCTVRSFTLKTPAEEKTLEAAERRLLLFERAFEHRFDDARAARLAEGFSAEIDVAGFRHSFAEPAEALTFIRDLKLAQNRGDDLATVQPAEHAEPDDNAPAEAPAAAEISPQAQAYMAGRINQEANAFLLRARRAPTEGEMQLLRMQVFQEAILRGYVPQNAPFPF